MFNFGYGSYPVKVTHCKIDFLQTVVQDCYKLKIVMLNYFSISYIYVYIHLMFSCENISFVCVANSPTVHVNGYSFRFDISYGNISFVLRTHRICKENHSCSRLLQTVPVMLNLFHHLILFDSIFPTEIFRSFYELTVSAKKTIVV